MLGEAWICSIIDWEMRQEWSIASLSLESELKFKQMLSEKIQPLLINMAGWVRRR